MRKTLFRLVLVALIAGMIGCGGGTSGSVTGRRISCSRQTGSGSCKGAFKRLSGTCSQDIEIADTGYQSVTAEVSVSVESGPVHIYIVALDGTKTSAEAEPGRPATLSGPVKVSHKDFRVYFEAVEGTASGVSYTVSYSAP